MFVHRTARLAGIVALAFAAVALTARPAPTTQPAAKKVKTALKVTVPEEDAELYIEDKQMKPTGKVREFVTPDIDDGMQYEYAFKVVWRPNNYTVLTRTKTVEFKSQGSITSAALSRRYITKAGS